MMGLFSRHRKQAADTGALGTTLIALRLDAGDLAPAGSTLVVFNAAGHARRVAAGKVQCEQGETAFCFHPGPYAMELAPFAAAPEWGLRLQFVVDEANPRTALQRFDLYLFSETSGRLTLDDFGRAVEMALQAELAQGTLELPPCTSLEEWHAFRAGLNQLMYTRYGVTVDDCVPVDLGDTVDYAAVLRSRAASLAAEEAARLAVVAMPIDAAAPTPGATARAENAPQLPAAEQDARDLRRLFLELPALGTAVRLLPLPDGLPLFQQHQAVLLRLGMAIVNVNTMPALGWAAPDQPLSAAAQARRSAQTAVARLALDEGWSLLARLQRAEPQQWPVLLDEADRICTNIETGLALRRVAHPQRMEPSL
jgi:hypothetical protein